MYFRACFLSTARLHRMSVFQATVSRFCLCSGAARLRKIRRTRRRPASRPKTSSITLTFASSISLKSAETAPTCLPKPRKRPVNSLEMSPSEISTFPLADQEPTRRHWVIGSKPPAKGCRGKSRPAMRKPKGRRNLPAATKYWQYWQSWQYWQFRQCWQYRQFPQPWVVKMVR
jgi:hypothetical protein